MTAVERPVVLFADDDPQLLDALRAALRRERRIYDLVFVTRSAEALEVLATHPVDVVIADLRMPDMDGVELLGRIRTQYPTVVRYALTADGTEDTVRRAMPLVHRWLSKPCDRSRLIEALAAAVRYRRLLADPVLAAAVTGIESLPAVPRLYGAVMALAASDDASAERVAQVAGSDPAIAAKLLQLANSAFATGERIDDLPSAVVRVGLTNIAQLVLSQEVLGQMAAVGPIPGFGTDGMRAFASEVGELAAEIARPEDAMAARVAGLLHATGLLIEAAIVGDRLAEAYAHALDAGTSLVEAERELFGLAHPDIAGHLLSIWGLPEHLVDAVTGAYDAPRGTTAPLPLVDAVRAARLEVLTRPSGSDIGAPHQLPVVTSAGAVK
jgi:HD-like signal output (HDOD) protein/ActR/RegA family two-component response regulator